EYRFDYTLSGSLVERKLVSNYNIYINHFVSPSLSRNKTLQEVEYEYRSRECSADFPAKSQ
ncbi:MAG: hypothetical protein WC970_06265, partial [Dehalococcoidales bacterium]